jgi:hypothetical protein
MTTTPWQMTEPGNPTEPDFKNPVQMDYEGREGMAAPGQEQLLEQFIQEQQAEAEPNLLAGKYKSPEELERAYKELESKLGQQQEPTSQPERQEAPSDVYTEDAARGLYGEEAVNKLAERGVQMADLMRKADAGDDISEHFDVLAETFGVPRQVVQNYVSKAGGVQAGAEAQPVASELTEADTAELRQMVGGDEKFAELSNWAAKNLTKDALSEYNEVVDSGNKAAIKWALRALQGRYKAPDAVVEPKLYGGGEAPGPQVFESQQQLMDAMNKRNDRGQVLYEVDEAYRNKVVEILSRSPI